jgi:hypothetical protein
VRITTEWKRYWVRWKQTPANNKKNIIVGRNNYTSNIYIRAVKFEAGNKASDWSPAPEDVEGAINNVDGKFADYYTKTETDSEIEQKADSISLSVKTQIENI